jgi:hypothetical protein
VELKPQPKTKTGTESAKKEAVAEKKTLQAVK